jgi:hypothetical protein
LIDHHTQNLASTPLPATIEIISQPHITVVIIAILRRERRSIEGRKLKLQVIQSLTMSNNELHCRYRKKEKKKMHLFLPFKCP